MTINPSQIQLSIPRLNHVSEDYKNTILIFTFRFSLFEVKINIVAEQSTFDLIIMQPFLNVNKQNASQLTEVERSSCFST